MQRSPRRHVSARDLLAHVGAALLAVACAWPGRPALAEEAPQRVPVVIDTDVGLDDAAALAAALQRPELDVRALLVVAGAASAERGLGFARRLLAYFNRERDVPLYRAVSSGPPAPPFRPAVERTLDAHLPQAPGSAQHAPRAFSAAAFAAPPRGKLVVLALGPLTNLAAALRADPGLAPRIERVVFRGAPRPADSWNVRFDPAAHEAVRAAGVPLVYVRSSPTTAKSAAWLDAVVRAPDALGAGLLARLTGPADVRAHYLSQLASFTDELAVLYLVQPELFAPRPVPGTRGRAVTVHARDRRRLLDGLARLLREGRQHRAPVLRTPRPLPASALRADVRARRAAILAAHGETEWSAQLLTNELHQHLGAYSVIGVKMGLRAAELLNAPPHAMRVVSESAPRPPASCLDDGVIVATGSTPGRGLYQHTPGAAGSTRVRFEYNGRSLTLQLKPRYQQQLGAAIAALAQAHGLADPRYWAGVRREALDVWQRWHRRELFEVVR